MLIQCTKKLSDQISQVQRENFSLAKNVDPVEDFFTWQANLVLLNRKKTIVLMHNMSRYPVILFRVRKNDYKKLDKLIQDAITETLRMECISEALIERYFEVAGPVTYAKTSDRKMVSKLNNTVRYVGYYYNLFDDDKLVQKNVSLAAGREIFREQDKIFYSIVELVQGFDLFREKQQDIKNQSVIDVTLFQLKIEIQLGGFKVWRRVLVPSVYTFWHLHNIIQTIFDWQNYHLHSFEASKKGEKKLLICMDQVETDWVNLDENTIVLEKQISLKDVLPFYDEVQYEYDFGDSWNHKIILEKQIKSDEYKASFIKGKGERPPEDCGGPPGYAEYMRIMADKDDPEHEKLKVWAEAQKQRDMFPDQINRKLKFIARGYHYY